VSFKEKMLAIRDVSENLKLKDDGKLFLKSLDERVKNALADKAAVIAATQNSVRSRYVEQLVSDCAFRHGNCVQLRNLAQDLEMQAVNQALSISTEFANLESVDEVLTQLGPLQGALLNQATKLKTAVGSIATDDNNPAWKEIHAVQIKLQTRLRAILEARREKAMEPSNGSNFVARHAELVEIFEKQLDELYSRCLLCSRALNSIYGISDPVPPVSDEGYIHKLGFWIQERANDLENILSNRLFGSVCFSFASVSDASVGNLDLMTPTQFSAALTTKSVSFDLTLDHFKHLGIAKPLIRSFSLFGVPAKAVETKSHLWLLSVNLPERDISSGQEIFNVIANSISSGIDKNEVFGAHNLSPIGAWRMRVLADSPTWSEFTSGVLANMGITLNLSYEKA
jgi:hypothetical protein